jgi:hypothetical protein
MLEAYQENELRHNDLSMTTSVIDTRWISKRFFERHRLAAHRTTAPTTGM